MKLKYQIYAVSFQLFCLMANLTALLFLGFLLFEVVKEGYSHINLNFISAYPSRFPEKAGILSAIVGSIAMMILTAIIAIPIGIGAAIYIEEYARDNRFNRLIKLNIQNLAGIPSIIYGILGLTLFVRWMELGRSLLAGAMTMALLILPVITITAQESIRAVPESFRLAGYGIGMTRWQTIRHQVLPLASPGMMTGIILALSRAIGETAPLIMIGALTFVAFLPASPMDSFTVLPIQIYNWTSRPQAGFHEIAASGIIILLIILLAMNAVTIWLRYYFSKKMQKIYS